MGIWFGFSPFLWTFMHMQKSYYVIQHANTLSLSGEKPFCCPECGRAFSLLWNLKTHLRTHTGEKPYCCDVCGRKFTQKQNMTSHMTTHKKPKLARSGNLYVTYTSSADNLDYFSVSELRQAGKATMVSKLFSWDITFSIASAF